MRTNLPLRSAIALIVSTCLSLSLTVFAKDDLGDRHFTADCREHLLFHMNAPAVDKQALSELQDILGEGMERWMPYLCANNVCSVADRLPSQYRDRVQVLVIVPLDANDRLLPMNTIDEGLRWDFHVVLLLDGRVLDPSIKADEPPSLEEYFRMVFHPRILAYHEIGLDVLSLKEYESIREQHGWFYFKYLFREERLINASHILGSEYRRRLYPMGTYSEQSARGAIEKMRLQASLQIHYFDTSGLEWPNAIARCIEGQIVRTEARYFDIRLKNSDVVKTLPFSTVTRVESKSSMRQFSPYGFRDVKAVQIIPCEPF